MFTAESSAAPSVDQLFSPQPASEGGPSANGAGSSMSDERNADSVLFQLDQLRRTGKHPSLAPELHGRDEPEPGSGIIDLHELTRRAPPSAAGPGVAAALPKPTLQAPLVTAPVQSAPSTAPVAAPTPSRVPFIVLSALAVLALGAAAAAVAIRGL